MIDYCPKNHSNYCLKISSSVIRLSSVISHQIIIITCQCQCQCQVPFRVTYHVKSAVNSQIRNKEKGLKILRSRIYEFERKKKEDERSKDRKSKIGTGDRSERIRTYNFPQGRVTDHRINLTLHKLEEFMEGDLFDEMIENLNLQAQEEKLTNLN